MVLKVILYFVKFEKVEDLMKLTIRLKDVRSVNLVLAQRNLIEISCLHLFFAMCLELMYQEPVFFLL